MEKKEQNAAEVSERIYQNAVVLYEGRLYTEAAAEFARIPDYKDSAKRQAECEELIVTAQLDRIYNEADKAAANMNVRSQEKAIKIFEKIPGYRDADERIEKARHTIEEIILKERVDREEAIRAARAREEEDKQRKKRRIRFAVIAAFAAAACIAGVFLFKKYAGPLLQYRRGVKMMEAGNYDEAYRTLHDLDVLESSDMVEEIAKERLKNAEIGSTVLFGYYPQGRKTSDEKDNVEWIVLDRDGSKLLLISKYAMNCLQYQKHYESLKSSSWRTSLIREWLNSSFLSTAFNKGEARMLVTTNVDEDNSTTNGSAHRGTMDKVFLLSVAEAEKYFPTNESRECLPTRFAIDYGAYQSSVGSTCFWWLRSTAFYTDHSFDGRETETVTRAALVGTNGSIIDAGHYVYNMRYAVRPVVWVDTGAAGD